MSGAWSMTEDGEFILNEPYKSELAKIKRDAMMAWVSSVVGYLEQRTDYDGQTILDAFGKRCKKDESPMDIVDSFVIETMEGNL